MPTLLLPSSQHLEHAEAVIRWFRGGISLIATNLPPAKNCHCKQSSHFSIASRELRVQHGSGALEAATEHAKFEHCENVCKLPIWRSRDRIQGERVDKVDLKKIFSAFLSLWQPHQKYPVWNLFYLGWPFWNQASGWNPGVQNQLLIAHNWNAWINSTTTTSALAGTVLFCMHFVGNVVGWFTARRTVFFLLLYFPELLVGWSIAPLAGAGLTPAADDNVHFAEQSDSGISGV